MVKSFDDPFQERVARANQAKQKALDLLKSKPAPDPAVAAERQARRLEKEARQAEERTAREAARLQARADKEAKAKAQAGKAAAGKPSEAELKAARDARYAARKNRK